MRPTVEEIAGDTLPAILVMLEKMNYIIAGTCTVRVIHSQREPYPMSFLYAHPQDEEQPKIAVYISGPWWDGEGKDCYSEYEIYKLNTQPLTVEYNSLERGLLYWSWREPGSYIHEPLTRESIQEDSVHWVRITPEA